MTALSPIPGLPALSEQAWDVVVIGAGPAGSTLARALALRGRSVLLAEKARFPRRKVCGACLGAAGVRSLERQGLGSIPAALGARPLDQARLVWRSRHAVIPTRGMVVISRLALDAALASAAAEAGAVFRDGVRASAWTSHSVTLESGDDRVVVRTRSVVVSAGLRAPAPDAVVWPGSRIGLGATGPADRGVPPELLMAVADAGYVGRVVIEDGRANWAAAVDPAFVRAAGSPAAAVRALCDEAGADADPPASGWTGTPALTRRARAQHGPVYRIGDAAAYAEPITGEGMSWALDDAARLAPILDRALTTGLHADAWARAHARAACARRLRCMTVARVLRSPSAMRIGMALLGRHAAAAPLAAALAHAGPRGARV